VTGKEGNSKQTHNYHLGRIVFRRKEGSDSTASQTRKVSDLLQMVHLDNLAGILGG
jgi:hypothetical protein